MAGRLLKKVLSLDLCGCYGQINKIDNLLVTGKWSTLAWLLGVPIVTEKGLLIIEEIVTLLLLSVVAS